MSPARFLNGVVCFVGIFLVILSFVGLASAMSAASVIGGATVRSPAAQPAIIAAERESRQQWFWCRIAGGVIVVLTIAIDFNLSRRAITPNAERSNLKPND